MAWSFTVPPEDAPRTGQRDHEIYNVAQWYPQVAVYDDLRGWNFQPYLGAGEFYLFPPDYYRGLADGLGDRVAVAIARRGGEVVGAAIFYAVAVAYFALVGRHKLILSPEEEFAMTRGEHGHPEIEGYGHTRLEAYGHPSELSADAERSGDG